MHIHLPTRAMKHTHYTHTTQTGAALQSSLDDLQTHASQAEARAQEAEAAHAALMEHLAAVQQQQQGPTAAQQEMLARMAQRLEALEAGHR